MTRLTWLLAVTGLASARGYDPEACLNSFTEVASNAIARSVFSHCIDVSPGTEQRTNEEIEIQDPLTTVRKYCPMEISTKLFHSAFYEILEAGWKLPQDAASPSRYNAISQISTLCKKGGMNHTARQKLGYLLAAIYDDHLPSGSHCLSMEDKKAAIEDMETTLSKVRNIVGSINFGGLLYLKKVTKPRVQLQLGDGQIFGDESLKKDGGESGDGTAADQLKILLDKPSIVYMSQSTGAPNAALIVGEEGEIDFDLFYRSVLKDTTPGTVMFLVSGEEFPADKIELVHTIAGNAQNQNILINVILLDPKYVTDQSRAFYHSLAMITGGLMYQSPRRAAHELIPIIESRFQPDQVTIVRNQRIQATRSGVYIDVPVDSTIAELLFEIKCNALRSFVIYNPRYRQHRDISTLVATSDNHLYSIQDVEPGNWQVIVDCDNDFYVEVRGQSPVDFRFTFASSNDQFKATSPFGLDSKKTITEDSDSYLLVHSLGVENVELQSVQFKSAEDRERVLPLYSVESLVSAFPMPSDAAAPTYASSNDAEDLNLQLAKIEGIDQSGFPVLRTHVLFPTKIMLIDSLDNSDFLPGTDTNVTIRVTNAYQAVKIQAADFEKWVKVITPDTTPSNKYYTDVIVTISPPATVPTGKMTTVTIIAQTEADILLGSLTFEVAAGQRARPSIESLDIETDISNKFAITKVTSNIRNDHPEAREAIFDALIPPNALITGLKLFVGGEVFSSDIKPAKPVSEEEHVASPISINPSPAEHHPHDHGEAGNRKGMTAAHILQRDAHRYEIKMMIDSWDNVTFELTYEELLERTQDRYQHWVSIAPSQIVNNLTTKINVNDLGGIKWIRAYPVQSGVDSFKPSTQADIKWNRGEGKAQIVYQPSPEDQSAFSQDGITGRMMTVFDTDHQRACDAMIQQNYFVQTCLPPKMHLKSNAGSATAPYHVVFALDKSGSMWGTKLDQTKEAFRSMISSLDREARFSILGFNYATSPWRTRLVKASPYNVEEARGFISRLSAGGGTNMHAALIDAVELCNSERDSPNVPCMILFMTDGTPTVGVTEEPRILTDVTRARSNGEASIAINIIGFGAGISHSFLSRLAATNNGIARQIFEDTDAAFQMQGFFEEVKKFTDTRRAMKSIEFLYDEGMMDYMTYNHFDASKMGAGQEFTVAGKLNGKQLGNFKSFDTQLKITEPSGDERIIKQSYEMKDIDLDNLPAGMPAINLKSAVSNKQEKPLGLNLAERIYRLQVIKQLIRERHMAHSAEEYNEITRKLIDISSNSMLDGTAYLSPVMSMSVAKPVTSKRSKRFADSFDEFDMMEKRQVAHVIQYEYRKLWWKNQLPEENKPVMASVNGSEATFKVEISNSTRKACFDVSARPGTDFNILKDNLVGLTVSGRSANDADGKMYFNQIRIQLGGETALISIQGGQILQESSDKSLKPLANDKNFQAGSWEIRKSSGKCSIKLGNEIELILTSTNEASGLEIVTYDNGSEAEGLIGQFLSRTLLLSNDEKAVLDGSKVIPVVENQNGNCYYTDDYTMKFLGRRYYDYIN